ncbi:MAG: prepilin-type N-terminal cleavage/methylation domain-containing protein [Deltaproteobacteria bacterium]|nr:prepilin-type N-terminal cleavage/methylation domain-containing protein [Deltaproteobacteria bacterium]
MTPKMVIKQNTKIPYYKGGDGFTLLEVLVAMVILAVGLLGMASLSIGIIKGNEFSKEISSATTCAREKLEDVEQLGFANTPTANTTVTETYNSITQYPEYRRETITTVDTPATDMKTITITVYWDNDNHQVQLKTFLAK